MEITDLMLYPERPNFDPNDSSRFDFEFKVPSGEEYCVTYIHANGSMFDPLSYKLDHVNRWDSDYGCTPVSIDEANEDLRITRFTVYDIFASELEKNKILSQAK